MQMFLHVAIGGMFFIILLASGARVFGATLGSPMRGAAIPLLFIPLLCDWLRFIFHISPATAFGVALVIYLLCAAGFFITGRPGSPLAAQGSRRWDWLLCLCFFLIAHILVRDWIFTGSVMNPGDDGYAGYKANALLHTAGWPTTLPEAPELPVAYYYYAYEWAPALYSWTGISFKAGWWVTAIALCVTGQMLVLELVLPFLRTRRDALIGAFAILNGCSISFLLGIAIKAPPKYWMQEQGLIAKRYGLYLCVPQATLGYWMPYAMFATGILMVALFFLWRLIEERRLRPAESAFAVLSLAALAGYCTFDLIGFAIVMLPVLTVAAIAIQRGQVVRRWFLPLASLGIASLALCLPLILLLLHRAPGEREGRFRDPLLVWLRADHPHPGVVIGLALLALLATAISNLLVWPILFQRRDEPVRPIIKCLLAIFFLGAFVCYFGVIDDFVPKFGDFVSVAAIVAFLLLEHPPKWSLPLLVCGLIGPSLLLMNNFRANIFLPKQDNIWRMLDAITAKTHEIVLYDVPVSIRDHRTPWQTVAPFFSHARILVPADEIDDKSQEYLVDPAQLKTLPPTEARLRAAAKGAPTYLLLRAAGAPPAGAPLYSSDLFRLDRLNLN